MTTSPPTDAGVKPLAGCHLSSALSAAGGLLIPTYMDVKAWTG